jgi:hypothetical protein
MIFCLRRPYGAVGKHGRLAVCRANHSRLRKHGVVQKEAEPNGLCSYKTVLPLHHLFEDLTHV